MTDQAPETRDADGFDEARGGGEVPAARAGEAGAAAGSTSEPPAGAAGVAGAVAAPAPTAPEPSTPAPPADSTLAAAESAADRPAVARWVATVFIVGGIAVIPWSGFLALTLPRTSQSGHYRVAWVGFDILLALVLFKLGWIAGRGPTVNDRVELPATAAATLLVVDAWFDTTTSADRGSLIVALIFAGVAELPLAAVCVWIARHAEEIREQRLRLIPILERRVDG